MAARSRSGSPVRQADLAGGRSRRPQISEAKAKAAANDKGKGKGKGKGNYDVLAGWRMTIIIVPMNATGEVGRPRYPRFSLVLNDTDTIDEMKLQIQRWFGIRPVSQTLEFGRVTLQGYRTLSDYNIVNRSRILLRWDVQGQNDLEQHGPSLYEISWSDDDE